MGKTFSQTTSENYECTHFCSPEKAMLDNQGKLDFNTEFFLFSEKFEPSSTENFLHSVQLSCFGCFTHILFII